MTMAIYKADSGATAFTSTTAAQTVVTFQSTSTDFGLQLVQFAIGFGGTTANPNVMVRIYVFTVATAGTSTAGATPVQVSGRTIAATNMTSNFQYTAEPTVKTYVWTDSVSPNGGTLVFPLPRDQEFDYFNSANMGFGLEITASVAVPVTGSLLCARI